MKNRVITAFAATILAATYLVSAASAQSLLGVIGGADSGALIALDGGPAGNSGAVNLGLGGGNGNVLDVNVPAGGGGSVLGANVAVGGSGGLVNANVGLFNNGVRVDADVGGSNGLLGVGVGIGGGGGDNGGGGNGAGGDGGGNGGNGDNGGGNGGGGNGGNGGGNGVAIVGGSSSGGGAAGCAGADPTKAWQLFDGTSFSGWERASNIEIVPVQLCPDDRRLLSQMIHGQQKHGQLQQAIRSDALIAAALGRSSFSPERVLGVDRSGARLTVYVY